MEHTSTINTTHMSEVGVSVLKAAVTHACSFQKRPCLYESEENIDQVEPLEKERFLCVSDGFVIYCLDLQRQQGKDEANDYCSEQPLPILSSLNLMEKGLPTSMGLFKLGSHAYMISGQEFPALKKCHDLKLPDGLHKKYTIKGSSRKTYHLSLALADESTASDDDGLSLSECHNIPPLKNPKFWPIVEKIGDQLHVIESLPNYIASKNYPCDDPIPRGSQH